MTYRIGIDTGGTFTDIVAISDTTGEVLTTKTPSTPDDPSRGLLNGVQKILRNRDEAPTGIYHGTTVATNALLEERFSSLGLITTRGFRHVLEIARQSVPSGYGNSYFWVKPDRIVPLHHVREVTERLNFRGEVITPFDDEEARAVARWFRDQGIVSIAICFIHAYANGAHERHMREILTQEYPDATVSISSEVLPEYREYERTITTVVDAFVKPAVREYVHNAESKVRALNGHGDPLPFLIMQSNGGVLSANDVVRQPITTLLSGPAAGALGASWLAGIAGFPNVLTIDAGGTSTDICVVEAGSPHVTTDGSVGRFPVKVPMIDIITIGTGGGSIAWTDASGGLRVGPKSAGATPGPMCYGQGGEQPTLTDANLLLGRLPPHLLGGEVPLDVERARFGLERLADSLNLVAVRLAAGILEIADWSQVNAVRQVTVKKGLDPREYAMVPFGGSGPLQGARVAQLLGIGTTVVPPHPGNVSAFGLLAVDLRSEYVGTLVRRENQIEPTQMGELFAQLEERAQHDLARQGVSVERRRLVRGADIRYFGQAYEVRVELPAGVLTADTVRQAIHRFHTAHERLYGYNYRDNQQVELVNIRVTAFGLIDRPEIAERASALGETASAKTYRDVYFGDRFIETPIFSRPALATGMQLQGPAIIEEYGSTTVVHPQQELRVDRFGNLLVHPLPVGSQR